MDPKSSTVELKIARLGKQAHGVVTREELLAAGVSSDEIRGRLKKGALIRQCPGVYRVGHCAPSLEAHYMAAVKACGKGAVLSGRAAAYLFGFIKGRPPAPEVTAPTMKRVKGVTTRRRRADARDAMTYRRIPITTVACTLVDLTAFLTIEDVARACHEAGVRYRTTPAQVEKVLARRPRTKGAGNLRKVLRGEERVTLSKLERGFIKALVEERLPLPITNRVVGEHRVDCYWPEHHLIVELDGYRYHHSRHAWEEDRRRERDARSNRNEYRRFSYGDVFEDRSYMLAEIRALTASSPSRRRGTRAGS
ncbi:MAG: type IV toxin-antitoxin system AbiEi family antitoxin domain-containing protein [Thermoleophilaceae bacterium]